MSCRADMATLSLSEDVPKIVVPEGNVETGHTTSEEEEDEEEVEPKLKYQRLSNDLNNILRKDAASCLAIHPKFIVLGSHWGVINVLDHMGNSVYSKELQAHTTTVNQISLDEKGDYLASCSDDGRIIIHGLYSTDYNQQQSFDRPIKAISIDPNFYKSGSGRRFITGDEKLILHEKGLFSRIKGTVLHEGDGLIRTIKWKGRFVAWASDVGVRVYDMTDRRVITLIKKDHSINLRSELYRCNLFWRDEHTLLMGWADTVKVCMVKQRQLGKDQEEKNLPTFYVEIVAMFNTDFYVCGIAPFEDNMVVLCCTKPKSNKSQQVTDSRPQLCIIEPHQEDYSVICTDVLSIRGYEEYRCNDYHLDCVEEDNLFYVISPKDIIVAKPRDADDHISWLMEHDRFEEALVSVTSNKKLLKRHNLLDVGRAFLDHLLNTGQFIEASRLCVKILGNDKDLWEEEVFKFAQIKQLQAIAPYLPFVEIQLAPAIYEMVLNDFLQSDYKGFHQLIREWPSQLYSIPAVVTAVLDKLTYDPNSSILLHCLGDLYSFDKKYDKALTIYLRLSLPEVFDLIQKHDLFKTLGEQLETLMVQDKEKATKLCLENVEKIPVDTVVKRLAKRQDLLFYYLDRLFAKDSQLGGGHHDLLVNLYAEFAPQKLMSFLRSSNSYPLQDALETCRQYALVPEQVYLLGRIGNLKQALELITEEMNDVHGAIDFCKEHDDRELWEDLIKYSLDKPAFINVLLHNIGTHVDPIVFIQRIDNNLEIPGLRDSLVKILQDYNLQISLREGCKKIVVADCFSLQERLSKQQRKGIAVHEDAICQACHGKILVKDIRHATGAIIFYCKHAFHEDCLPGIYNTETCTICSMQKRGPGGASNFRST